MAKEEFDWKAQGAIVGLELFKEYGNPLFTIVDAIEIINKLKITSYAHVRIIYDSCVNNPHNSKYNHDKFTKKIIEKVYPDIFC